MNTATFLIRDLSKPLSSSATSLLSCFCGSNYGKIRGSLIMRGRAHPMLPDSKLYSPKDGLKGVQAVKIDNGFVRYAGKPVPEL
jgi:hypothetical protein